MERRDPGEPDRECQRMADGERIGEPERLHGRGQHLKPGAVVPERELDGLELRAVGEAAGVPGERLRPVVVGVEFVDRHPVVGRGGQPDDQRDGEQCQTHGPLVVDRDRLGAGDRDGQRLDC